MREEKGYFKVSRNILTWEWHDVPSMVALWVTLIGMANWIPGRYHGVDVPRGSLITSYRHLADQTGLSLNQVRSNIVKLQKTGEIEVKSTQQWTQINIVNFDKYQGSQAGSHTLTDTRTDTVNDTVSDTLTDTRTGYNIRKKEGKNKEGNKQADVWDKLDILYQMSKDCYSPFNDQDIMDKVDQAHDFMVKTVHSISGPLSMNSLKRIYEIAEEYFIDNNPNHITNPGSYIAKILKSEQGENNATDNAE